MHCSNVNRLNPVLIAVAFIFQLVSVPACFGGSDVIRIEVNPNDRLAPDATNEHRSEKYNVLNDLQVALDQLGSNQGKDKNIEIVFSSGTYHIRAPIRLNHRHHQFASIVFKGPVSGPRAQVVGTELFTLPNGGADVSSVSIPLTDAQINNYFHSFYGYGKAIHPHLVQLFLNGRRISPVQWPNDGEAEIISVVDQGERFLVSLSTVAQGLTQWPATTLGAAARLSGYFVWGYAFESVPCIVVGRGLVSVAKKGLIYGIRLGGRVTVQNVTTFEKSSKFFVNQNAHQVQVTGESGGNVEIPVAAGFIRADGMRNITLENLDLFGFTTDAIVFANVEDANLEKMTIRGIGGRAVVIDGRNVSVRDSVLDDLGEGGIAITGGSRIDLSRGDNVVRNTRISNFDVLARSYRPAVKIDGVGNSILNNVLSDGNQTAIMFSGNDHTISGNRIARVVRNVRDSGAIYAGRDWTTYGTIIENNIFEDVHNTLPDNHNGGSVEAVATKGIYLDDGISGITIRHNTFINTPWSIFINGGKDNSVSSNIFIASVPPIFASGLLMYLADRYLSPSWLTQTILSDLAERKSRLVQRHPNLWEERFSNEILKPTGNTIENNIYVNSGEIRYYKLNDRPYFKVSNNRRLDLGHDELERLELLARLPQANYETVKRVLCLFSPCEPLKP